MSKLDDMLMLSRKLAAGSPQTGDRLLWSAEDYSQTLSRFLYRGERTQGLAVDPPLPLLQEIAQAGGPCTVVWSALAPHENALAPKALSGSSVETSGGPSTEPSTEPSTGQINAQIIASRRRPADLRLSDEAVRQALSGLRDLHDVQALLADGGGGGAPWIGDGTCGWIAAPFMMNTLGDADLSRALAECRRTLAPDGVFRCAVLAADEPGCECPLTYAGYAMQRIPLETQISADLARAGFHGITLTGLAETPILTSGGAELRLLGVEAYLGTAGICLDHGDAAVYLGPWKSVEDDDGHTYPRGVRIAVCAKTARVLARPPYAGSFLILKALEPPAPDGAPLFDCSRDAVRDPGETKGRIPVGRNMAGEGRAGEETALQAAGPSAAQDGAANCGPGCGC